MHRSLLPWLSLPSVTHAPPLVSWQYCPPLVTDHMTTTGAGARPGGYGGGGGDGGGGGGGGGGDGDGGGGGGGGGGAIPIA